MEADEEIRRPPQIPLDGSEHRPVYPFFFVARSTFLARLVQPETELREPIPGTRPASAEAAKHGGRSVGDPRGVGCRCSAWLSTVQHCRVRAFGGVWSFSQWF